MFRLSGGLRTILIGAGASLSMISAATLASAVTPAPTETVFAMTNNADRNEIIAFASARDGQFYETGRFETGGRGSGGTTDPLTSQGSLTFSSDHSLLFAVNAGSGTLSVFRVFQNRLILIDRAPTGGAEPAAVAQWGNLVYVLNEAGPGTVVGFHLSNDGHLTSIPNSSAFLTGTNVGGSSITISPNGQFLAVTERASDKIDVFPINANGTLGSIVTDSSVNPGTFAARFAPEGNLVVSETGPAGATNGSTITSYAVGATGALTPITNALPTFGSANCWNAITPDGRYVYVSNAASATISGFAIGKNGALTPLGNTVLASNPQGATNLDIAVSGDGKYLFTLNSGAGAIGVFTIQSNGSLTPAGEIPGVPANTGLNGIAAE
ncbi:lactonase family protein [Acidicapsa dinghuensis]|uniref:Lactonase family protein n=1 Tax=Acidicapsa dinghuensis TaxID=2218256 RepID=A0ABW1EKN1_9BACT|nr:lactonase family protein [Acidicapsa dinghuensis]